MGLYLTAWLFRVLRTHYNCLLGSAAQLSILPDQKLSIRIHVPPRVKWAAGQHVFLRFYGQGIWFYFFSSHPFTIASLHQEKEATKDLEADRESSRTLDVVSKVHDGITKALFKLAGRGRDVHVKVLVDGPYGGLPRGIVLEDFNSVLLLAGGTGGEFSINCA
jgi:predicted ferric reductase